MTAMNRSSFALLGSIVLATAGVAITSAAPAQADKYPKAGQSPTNPADWQILGDRVVGSQLKQEHLQALPIVLNGVVKDAAGRTGKPTSELEIVEFKQQTWSNGCLGLGGAGVACTQGKVPGWKVTVGSGENRWVYRTNQSGTLIKLDEAASRAAIAQTSKPTSTQQQPTLRPSGSPQASTPRTTPQSTQASGTRPQRPPLRPIQLPGQASIRTSPPPARTIAPTTRPSQVPVRPSSPPVAIEPVTRQTQQPARQVAPNQPVRVSFTDVPVKHWARDFIAELADKQIIKGSEGRFRPDAPVTRGELAAMLSLAFKKPNIREAVELKDVTPDEWVHSYILDVYQRGFFDLEPGNVVNPNKNVSRLDVLVALAKGLNYSPGGSPPNVLRVYSDASNIPSNLRNLVAAATEQGLVVNYPDVKVLNPERVATRAEVAALIYQGMVSTGEAVDIFSPYVVGEQKNTDRARNARDAQNRPRR